MDSKTLALHVWPPEPMEGVAEPGPLPPSTQPEPAPPAVPKRRLERTASGSKRRRNEGGEEGSTDPSVLGNGEDMVLEVAGDSSDEDFDKEVGAVSLDTCMTCAAWCNVSNCWCPNMRNVVEAGMPMDRWALGELKGFAPMPAPAHPQCATTYQEPFLQRNMLAQRGASDLVQVLLFHLSGDHMQRLTSSYCLGVTGLLTVSIFCSVPLVLLLH